jgi:hypothetical protein
MSELTPRIVGDEEVLTNFSRQIPTPESGGAIGWRVSENRCAEHVDARQ